MSNILSLRGNKVVWGLKRVVAMVMLGNGGGLRRLEGLEFSMK